MIFFKRIISYYIDFFVIGFLSLIILAVIGGFGQDEENILSHIFPFIGVFIWLSSIFIGSLWIYIFKRTIGQHLMNIQFYQKDDLPIRFWRNIIVHMVFINQLFPILLIPHMISSLWDDDLLVDKISNLYVREYQK